jgi:hypothetical protein
VWIGWFWVSRARRFQLGQFRRHFAIAFFQLECPQAKTIGKKPKQSDESQIAIDRLVATTRSHRPPRNQDVQALIDSWGGDVLGNAEHIWPGVWVASIEFWCNDRELAASEDIDQNEITDAHRIRFAREKLARECVDFDADTSPGFCGVELTSSNGQRAWAGFTITGFPLTGFDIKFFGIFADLETLTQRLRRDGFASAGEIGDADDTISWITDKQILKLWSR